MSQWRSAWGVGLKIYKVKLSYRDQINISVKVYVKQKSIKYRVNNMVLFLRKFTLNNLYYYRLGLTKKQRNQRDGKDEY